jgi:hypothetical protein
MVTDLIFNSSVMEVDRLIRRAMQDCYLEIQPPTLIWINIQHRLGNRNRGVPVGLMRGLHSKTTSRTTRRTNHG